MRIFGIQIDEQWKSVFWIFTIFVEVDETIVLEESIITFFTIAVEDLSTFWDIFGRFDGETTSGVIILPYRIRFKLSV